MARFYGTVQGSRGEASRLGGAGSGLSTYAASWQGAVSVRLYEQDGVDRVCVALAPHRGHGIHRQLYDGPVDPQKYPLTKGNTKTR